MRIAVERALRAHQQGQEFQPALEKHLQEWFCEQALQQAARNNEARVTRVDPNGQRHWTLIGSALILVSLVPLDLMF